MLSTFLPTDCECGLISGPAVWSQCWLAIAVEKPWAESDALRDLHQCDNQSDRVVVALRNLLFGSAALASVPALRFTILSTVGLTIAGYPSEMKADAYSVACVQNQRPRP